MFSTVSSLLTVTAGILVARWLGPAGKGTYSTLALLQGGLTGAIGGVGAALTYALTKQQKRLTQLIIPVFLLAVVVTTVSWVGLAIWGRTNSYTSTWLVFFLTVPAVVVVAWQAYLFMGLGRIRTLNTLSVARAVLSVGLLYVAVRVLGKGINGALASWGIVMYANAIAVVAYAALGGPPERAKAGHEFVQLFRYGARSGLGSFLGFLNYRIDSILTLAFLGVAGFGVYSVATAGSETLYMISRAVSTASAHRIGSSALVESAATTAKAVRTITAIVSAVAVCLGITAPWLVRVLYGDRFQTAILPFELLLPGVVAFASGGIFSSFIIYQLGRPAFGVYLTAAVVVLEAAGCLVLIPRYGMAGAAIASTLTYFLASVGSTWYFCSVAGLRVSDVWIVKREDLSGIKNVLFGQRAAATSEES